MAACLLVHEDSGGARDEVVTTTKLEADGPTCVIHSIQKVDWIVHRRKMCRCVCHHNQPEGILPPIEMKAHVNAFITQEPLAVPWRPLLVPIATCNHAHL